MDDEFIKHFLIKIWFLSIYRLALLQVRQAHQWQNSDKKSWRLLRSIENGRSPYVDKIIACEATRACDRTSFWVTTGLVIVLVVIVIVVDDRQHFEIRTRAYPLGRCEPRDEPRWKIDKGRLNDVRTRRDGENRSSRHRFYLIEGNFR